MKYKRRYEIKKGEVDIAPFLNVFFVLLVFFMFSSSFIFQPGIKVSLPKAVSGEIISQENSVMTVTSDDDVYLNDRRLRPNEIASNLRIMARDKTPLLIKADRASSLGVIVGVLDTCRTEGVSQVSIATVQEGR